MSKALWENPLADGDEEITNTVERLLQSQNLYIRPMDGRIAARFREQSLSTPWVHIAHATNRHCGIWNQVYCQQFKLIPHFCRYYCWKTVIKPPTVEALFHLEGLLHSMNLPSKCGIDVRDYTPGAYAGFIYGDSMEQGRFYHRKISKAIAQMGFDWPVLLKRACTEMEFLRPSDQWDPMTEQERILERKLDDIFVKEEGYGHQNDWHKNSIRRRWVRHAMSIGDETWKNLAGNIEGMHPHVVHYQDAQSFEATKSRESMADYDSWLIEQVTNTGE